eukprot:170652-Chlamydomonas_euryale.AAC.1
MGGDKDKPKDRASSSSGGFFSGARRMFRGKADGSKEQDKADARAAKEKAQAASAAAAEQTRATKSDAKGRGLISTFAGEAGRAKDRALGLAGIDGRPPPLAAERSASLKSAASGPVLMPAAPGANVA